MRVKARQIVKADPSLKCTVRDAGTLSDQETNDRLAGQVVKASASRAKDPEFESYLRRDYTRSSHTSDLKIATPVANLPGAWRFRVSAGTDWPCVSML